MATHAAETNSASLRRQWGRNSIRIAAAAALLFVAVYGSDIALTARLELFLGLDGAAADSSGPPWRPWAYVPIAPPAQDGDVSPELGQPVFEGHFESPNLAANDLYQQVRRLRKELRIRVDGFHRNDVPFAPLRSLVSRIGGEMKWPGEGKATVFSDDGRAVFFPQDKRAERNYEQVALPHRPIVADDEFFVSLASVAKLYDMSLSREPATGLYALSKAGREVRVLVADRAFRIEIDRSDRWLRVHYAGALAKQYRACVGEGGNTPLGEFHIESKCVWPGWRAYWGEYIPGGTRRNPLGARFLRTTARGRVTGWAIGIHGTNQPSSIGRRISGGCVRLLNKNIIELYEVIPVGTEVSVHE